MITTPTWATIPALGTTATKNLTNLDQANLYATGVLYPAEHLNQFTYWFANNANVDQSAVTSLLTENQNSVTATGQALAPDDNFQLIKSMIAVSHRVGELIWSEVTQTPAIWTSGSATYNPVIARWDADHTVTSAQAPDLVTAYRAEKANINVNGVAYNQWTGTVAASVITFASNAQNLAMLNMIVNEATANGYIATQTAGAAAVFTGTAQRCINVNGTDYPIVGASVGGLTVTVTGTPTSGSQTCILFTYRIAGSTTSVVLPRISGFGSVATYDYDGNFIHGWRKMDQMQGHFHSMVTNGVTVASIGGSTLPGAGSNIANSGTGGGGSYSVSGPITDGTNGTTRAGKTTDPRAYGLLPYTWAARLLA